MKELNDKKVEEAERIQLQKLKEEEEQEELLKASANFKATPIRRYKPIDSSHIQPRELTCPIDMDLRTEKRSQMRQ